MPNEDLRQMQINLDRLTSGKKGEYELWLFNVAVIIFSVLLHAYWDGIAIAFAFITCRPMLVYTHTVFRQYRSLQNQIKVGKVSPSTAITFNFAYQYRELPEAKLDYWASQGLTAVGVLSAYAVVFHGIALIDWPDPAGFDAFAWFCLFLAVCLVLSPWRYRESELQTQKAKMAKLNEIMVRIRGDQAHAMGTEK